MDKLEQHNIDGHNIGGDYISGNKIEQINGIIYDISNNKAVIINISQQIADKLRPEDVTEFGKDVAENRILEYKNLLSIIDHHCDLSQYNEAFEFVKEANKICHNHHILLCYHALCVYTTSTINDLLIEGKKVIVINN